MSEAAVKQQPRFKERLEGLCVEMIDRGILFGEAREQFELCFLSEVVRRCNGNLLRASSVLGIHRNTLAKRMRKKGKH